MELNMNTNRTKGHSLDEDDNFSNISRISFGMMNSIRSACNSDSECSGPISVRDMIQHYNSQFQKEAANQINCRKTYKINATKKYHHPSQHLLAATKSSYCGLNNYGCHMNGKQFVDQMVDNSSASLPLEDHNQAANTCCKNCSACTCCHNRSRKNSTATKMLSSTSTSFLLQQNNENNKKPSSNFSIHNNDTVDVSGGCNGCGIRSSNGNCNKINVKDTRILAVENCTNIHNNPGKNDDDTTSASTIKPAVLNDFCAELHTKSNSNGLFKNHNSQVVVENKMNRLLSTDSVEEANNICQQPPIETSYQSKTTIAKTSSGVRIIIDIYFDQEQCANATDIVGSRVETDIPQSRILTEFQQQTMSTNGCTSNTSAANISY